MQSPSDWPIGSQYATVTTVSHTSPMGANDPYVVERMCLASEAMTLISQIQQRNTFATAYVSQTRVWRGMHQ